MFCNKCGTQLTDEALFCHKCGNKTTKLDNNSTEFFSESIETVSIEGFDDSDKDNVTVALDSFINPTENKLPENEDVSSANSSSEAIKNHSVDKNFNTTEIPPLGNVANPVVNDVSPVPSTTPAKASGLTNKKALILAGIIAIIIALLVGIIVIAVIIGVVSSSSGNSSSSSSSYDDSYYDSYDSSYNSDNTSEDTIETLAVTALYNELSDHFDYTDYYDIGSTRYSVATITDSGNYWVVRGTFTMYDYYGQMSSTYYNETFVVTINKDTYSTSCSTSL